MAFRRVGVRVWSPTKVQVVWSSDNILCIASASDVIPFLVHWIFPLKVNRNKNVRLQNHLLLCSQNENTAWLWIISALVASNCSQITFFILAYGLTSISEGFWPNFDQINISPNRQPFFVWIVNSLTWQNSPEGRYDEKSWEMACSWLMMTSSAEFGSSHQQN